MNFAEDLSQPALQKLHHQIAPLLRLPSCFWFGHRQGIRNLLHWTGRDKMHAPSCRLNDHSPSRLFSVSVPSTVAAATLSFYHEMQHMQHSKGFGPQILLCKSGSTAPPTCQPPDSREDERVNFVRVVFRFLQKFPCFFLFPFSSCICFLAILPNLGGSEVHL